MCMNTIQLVVHFNTHKGVIYKITDNKIDVIGEYNINLNSGLSIESIAETINDFVDERVKYIYPDLNNENTRLFATGYFQDLDDESQNRLVISTYVNQGLYLNILKPDIEQFYLTNSAKFYGHEDLVKGLLVQEFRTVVICGSFQEHLEDIGKVMKLLQKNNTKVLSPWTTNVVPETLGTNFILLEGQELKNERDAWRHKYEHMYKFKQADAIIICNPGGVVGRGTMFEFGYMIANFKRIIFLEKPTNLSILFPYEIGLKPTVIL